MSALPPDEAWWERFFFDREKAVEQLMAREAEVGLDQALDEMEERVMAEAAAREALRDDEEDDGAPPFDPFQAMEEFEQAVENGEIDLDVEERVPEWAAGNEELNEAMRDFTHTLFTIKAPEDAVTAAMKAGAHVAGAHGIGYYDDSLCGNIVKLRWADDQLRVAGHFLEGHPTEAELAPRCQALRRRLQERIARFRARTWWQHAK